MNPVSPKTDSPRPAVIYCRVSDRRQTLDGTGLQSQEHRCREYAKARGYVVEAVFRDDMSGGGDFRRRPGMAALIGFLEQRPQGHVVIFDDLKRLARDTVNHLLLKQTLSVFDATVESPNFRFDDTPENEFIETVLAAQAQLERVQNRKQVLQKMKARVERGHYVFAAPVGYRYARVSAHGRTIVPDEPLASIVKEALEGYASGRFSNEAELKRWLETQPAFPKSADGRVRRQEVVRLLSRSVYAGYVESPRWGVARRAGLHEALITPETFARIEARRREHVHAAARPDLHVDFPLRGAVRCQACGSPLTAAWFHGNTAWYPYYLCAKAGCPLRRKSIRRETLERDFEELLAPLAADAGLVPVARAMFRDLWACALKQAQAESERLDAQHQQLQEQTRRMRERIASNPEPAVVAICERGLSKLAERAAHLRRVSERQRQVRQTFDEALATMLRFLTAPVEIWREGNLAWRRALLRLVLAAPLIYTRDVGFQAPHVEPPFSQQALKVVGARMLGACPPAGKSAELALP